MAKKMYFTVLVLLFAQAAFAQAQKTITLSISNVSALPFQNKVVAIPWQLIKAKWPLLDTAKMTVTDTGGRALGFQLENRGSSTIRHLLVQVTVPANAAIRLRINEGRKTALPAKVLGRLVPERYDDFAWENDRIAYRMYGKALEATSFNAYGIDVWAKRTEKLVIDAWYKGEDYHTDHGEGLDFYGVGYTLGAGNNAPYRHDSLYHARNFIRAEILDSGPLRFTFRLTYEPWLVDGSPVQKSMTISLDAGEQLNRVETDYVYSGDTLPLAAGVNLKAGAGEPWLNPKENIIGYWLPRDSANGTIGVGLVFTKPARLQNSNGHLLGVASVSGKHPLVYYAGGVWDKAGAVTSANDWFAYLKRFQQQLRQPLRVTVQ